MLAHAGTGFGALALSHLMQAELLAGDSPLAAKITHHAARADNVIFLFMEGGPSHIDTFDPKPKLDELAGQPLPKSFKRVVTAMGEVESPLLASKRKWKQHGESGLWISDWLPNIAKRADDLCVLRSCWTNGINHSGGVCQMNTGTPLGGRPSLGAWATYGLGTVNQSLPAFVVIEDNFGKTVNGPRNWGSGFMPAVYQGTALTGGKNPIANLNLPPGVDNNRQIGKLKFLDSVNQRHASSRSQNSELEARIRSYELAFRMQAEAPEAVDLSQETEATQELYGLHQKETEGFGRNCLLARRLVERGVRFVQLYHGSGSKWDAHSGIEANHSKMCGAMDLPVAGLIEDLKQRGLLERTLVLWGGEFGRTPMSEKGDGRDHNPTGFTMFMAGGGVKAGTAIGTTDELGFHAVEKRVHVHDLHATVMHALGVDHKQMIYYHKGRPERIDQNEGHVCHDVFA